MPVPNTFANATTSIPLSQLDTNFATAITLGNTAIQLGNTVSTLNNMTLANVTISSGTVTVANVTVTGVGTFAAGSNTAPSITTAGDTNTGIYFPAADTIAFTEGGVESMRIDSSGNVGIGTSLPLRTLHVVSNAAETQLLLRESDSSGPQLLMGADSAVSGSIINASSVSGSNSNLLLQTGGTERARIDSSGNLMVGTASRGPVNASAFDLDVTNSVIYCSHANGKASGSEYIQFGYNGSGIGSITQNGTTAVAYNTSSDYRLKHDVQPMAAGLSTVAALKPVTYKWNADNSYGEGFIAHELQAVIPQAVSGEKDAVNDDGSIKPQGVDYSKIVVHLVAAIQELSAKVAALEAKQ